MIESDPEVGVQAHGEIQHLLGVAGLLRNDGEEHLGHLGMGLGPGGLVGRSRLGGGIGIGYLDRLPGVARLDTPTGLRRRSRKQDRGFREGRTRNVPGRRKPLLPDDCLECPFLRLEELLVDFGGLLLELQEGCQAGLVGSQGLRQDTRVPGGWTRSLGDGRRNGDRLPWRPLRPLVNVVGPTDLHRHGGGLSIELPVPCFERSFVPALQCDRIPHRRQLGECAGHVD